MYRRFLYSQETCLLTTLFLLEPCNHPALESVYTKFCEKLGKNNAGTDFDATSHDYFVFHAPYNKLVSKSYGRLFFLDARKKNEEGTEEGNSGIDNEWLTKPLTETYTDKALEKVLKTLSKDSFDQRLGDANVASKMVGNTYAASVFFGLASLIDRVGGREELTAGKSIAVFSYGSGALASMYRLSV